MTKQWIWIIAATLSLCGLGWAQDTLPGAGGDTGKAVLYRDTWGIAHIYAPTVESGVYAMGWAQAEDRPEELLKNIMRALGESSAFDGAAGIQADMVVQLYDLYGTVKRKADELRPELWGYMRAYVKGVNDFYAAHPEDVPEWWKGRQVDEYMATAFGRLFLYSWSIDDAFGDLQAGGIKPGYDAPQRGSNQWSVSPARSAVGAPMLYIDPHLSWWGSSRFWAFRIHAGALQGSGVTLPGFPYIGLGHNANIAWAMTTGGPDTADIYELTLKKDDPEKYLYDGEYRAFEKREASIPVKGADALKIPLYISHLGPVVAMRNGKAYAAAMAYTDQVRVFEAWDKLNFAKDFHGAVEAMETQQVFPQNVMVADTSGNIYYQRTGRVPKRPSGYDWSKPVDGSTSKTAWQGFHPSSDFVQILNPPQGYMQNCNISPDVMMVDSPLTPDKNPAYIFNTSPKALNQRGARALQLLSKDSAVTIEKALEYAVDTHTYGADRWVAALKKADENSGQIYRSHPGYAEGLKDLLAWDGEVRPDSTGALKYYYWRKQIEDMYSQEDRRGPESMMDGGYLDAIGKPLPPMDLSGEILDAVASAFDSAMDALQRDYGRLNVPYGEKFRVGRDEKSWPVGGGDDSLTTLRNMSYGQERPDHTRWGQGGQTSTQLCVMTKPVQSWMYLPVGESDRPGSPHYRDLAEKAFSPGKLQPTWWTPESLKGHIETRTVLDGAPR